MKFSLHSCTLKDLVLHSNSDTILAYTHFKHKNLCQLINSFSRTA